MTSRLYIVCTQFNDCGDSIPLENILQNEGFQSYKVQPDFYKRKILSHECHNDNNLQIS